jgi:hypothetical protein
MSVISCQLGVRFHGASGFEKRTDCAHVDHCDCAFDFETLANKLIVNSQEEGLIEMFYRRINRHLENEALVSTRVFWWGHLGDAMPRLPPLALSLQALPGSDTDLLEYHNIGTTSLIIVILVRLRTG